MCFFPWYLINQYVSVCLVHTLASLSEMRSRVSCLEEELSVKAGTLKSIQNEVVQNKKELAARELSLQRARDELSLAHTRITQESERVKSHSSAATDTAGGATATVASVNKCFIPESMFSISFMSCCLCQETGFGLVCQNISPQQTRLEYFTCYIICYYQELWLCWALVLFSAVKSS